MINTDNKTSKSKLSITCAVAKLDVNRKKNEHLYVLFFNNFDLLSNNMLVWQD